MTTNKAICDQQRSLEEEDSHLAAKKDNAEDLLDMIMDNESESNPAIKLPDATLSQGQSGSISTVDQSNLRLRGRALSSLGTAPMLQSSNLGQLKELLQT